MEIYDGFTWKCHVCGEIRPDDKISVRQHPLVVKGLVMGNQNVRYCNDNPDCIEKSKTTTFMDHDI